MHVSVKLYERLFQKNIIITINISTPYLVNNFSLPANNIVINYEGEKIMAKDSQIDPKPIRKAKSNGGPTMAESALDGESRNSKHQSGNRHKPGKDI